MMLARKFDSKLQSPTRDVCVCVFMVLCSFYSSWAFFPFFRLCAGFVDSPGTTGPSRLPNSSPHSARAARTRPALRPAACSLGTFESWDVLRRLVTPSESNLWKIASLAVLEFLLHQDLLGWPHWPSHQKQPKTTIKIPSLFFYKSILTPSTQPPTPLGPARAEHNGHSHANSWRLRSWPLAAAPHAAGRGPGSLLRQAPAKGERSVFWRALKCKGETRNVFCITVYCFFGATQSRPLNVTSKSSTKYISRLRKAVCTIWLTSGNNIAEVKKTATPKAHLTKSSTCLWARLWAPIVLRLHGRRLSDSPRTSLCHRRRH